MRGCVASGEVDHAQEMRELVDPSEIAIGIIRPNERRDYLVDARRDDMQLGRGRRPRTPLVEEEHLHRATGNEGSGACRPTSSMTTVMRTVAGIGTVVGEVVVLGASCGCGAAVGGGFWGAGAGAFVDRCHDWRRRMNDTGG